MKPNWEKEMVDLNYMAVVAAAAAVFLFAAAYYTALAATAARLSPAWAQPSRSPALTMAFELGKSLALALVVTGLVTLLAIGELTGAVALGITLWIAFPLLLLAGSAIHEKVPLGLVAIHAGDWLAKLLIIALIVAMWP